MNVMEDATYLDLIAKDLSGNITSAEKQELMAWVEASEANKAFFEESLQLWSISDSYVEQFDANLDTAWQTITQKLPKEEVAIEKTGKVIPIYRFLRAAAAVLLLMGAGYWWYSNETPVVEDLMTITTGEAEQKEITLPDGSIVMLNENTRLAYLPSFKERNVELEGEAFFKVDRQEEFPFTILSGDATTTVLGTSFNVRAYKEEASVEVSVEEGKVAFKKNVTTSERPIILEKGESGIYNKEEQTIKEEIILNADAWKTKRLNFPDIEYKEVLPSLERYFDVKIEVTNPLLLKCNFNFNQENPELENILASMAFSTGVEVEMTADKVYKIKGKGCN